MKSTLSNVVIFAAGLAIGSAATWQFFKNKYERIAQEEIDSVKEVYSRKNEPIVEPEPEEEHDEYDEPIATPEMRDAYSRTMKDLGYINYSDIPKTVEKEDAGVERPYVISPEDYGEIEEYEQIELTLYADDVLTDDMGEPVDDVDDVVGLDSLNHFGEYEDDSVHVRNDSRKCDYEILRDMRNFADLNKRPHRMEE